MNLKKYYCRYNNYNSFFWSVPRAQIKFFFVFLATATTVQEAFYSTTTSGPTITGTITVVANQQYQVKIEVMKIDMNSNHEYVSSITLNGASYGTCNGNGQGQCDVYQDCSVNIGGHALTQNTITSSSSSISVVLTHTSSVNCCACTYAGVSAYAVARITLTPT